MPTKCVINECQSMQTKNCGISFFRFPLDDKLLSEKWITAIHKTQSSITAYSRICERHFKKEFLSEGQDRKRLKINAVPTEFLTLRVDPLQEQNKRLRINAAPTEPLTVQVDPLQGQNKRVKINAVPTKFLALRVDPLQEQNKRVKINTVPTKLLALRVDPLQEQNKRLKINVVPTKLLALRVDPLQEQNGLINLHGQVKTGCKEEIVAKRDVISNICNRNAHIVPISVKGMYLVRMYAYNFGIGNSNTFVYVEIVRTNKCIPTNEPNPGLQIVRTNKCLPTNEPNLELQIKTLKADNERLRALVQSLKDDHTRQLENQAEMFRHLLREQKEVMKNKLTSALNKVKLLKRQRKRLDVKITDLKKAKDKKIITKSIS
ncbi:hypothetical protein DMN91_008027 [Ooceraea biroi]|uniref:THAP-type domain-containing protein n=1 Tax=Ooceraea biroi TaxID=2015173 RepID=A0A3L8DGA6_OOCBI|nr:uncharacterized protein LOC105287826 isoform X1 [Ooceraea biroi]RLU19470.1 hypothetical protein DMN91_008027 [Ooceraea biroi]